MRLFDFLMGRLLRLTVPTAGYRQRLRNAFGKANANSASRSVRVYQRSNSIALMAIAITTSFCTFASAKAIASETIYFQVPSGNIHCGTDGTYLDCEIGSSNATLPPKPKSCDLDWGNRFVMSPNGVSQRACHGDTLGRNPKHPILGYGKTWRKKGFTCISKPSGLTCKNVDGRGWTLSKNKQQLF